MRDDQTCLKQHLTAAGIVRVLRGRTQRRGEELLAGKQASEENVAGTTKADGQSSVPVEVLHPSAGLRQQRSAIVTTISARVVDYCGLFFAYEIHDPPRRLPLLSFCPAHRRPLILVISSQAWRRSGSGGRQEHDEIMIVEIVGHMDPGT
jgi:hypothetical protein